MRDCLIRSFEPLQAVGAIATAFATLTALVVIPCQVAEPARIPRDQNRALIPNLGPPGAGFSRLLSRWRTGGASGIVKRTRDVVSDRAMGSDVPRRQ